MRPQLEHGGDYMQQNVDNQTPHTSARNIRPQLEHGGDYMQQNVNNQTQFYQMRVACANNQTQDTAYVYASLGYAA